MKMATLSKRKRKRSPSHLQQQQQKHTDETLLEQVTNPNFAKLACSYPDFAKAWQNLQQRKADVPASLSSLATPEFNLALTRALLHSHFELSLPTLPASRLCPSIPNRYFYVQWIQSELLPLLENNNYFVPWEAAHDPTQDSDHTTGHRRQYYGCDIGTGASCIYPLLFHANLRQMDSQQGFDDSKISVHKLTDKNWTIIATDVDSVSIEAAKENVHANHFDAVINVIPVNPTRAQLEQHNSNQPCDDDVKNNDESGGPICRALHAFASTLQHPTTTSTACSSLPYFDFVMTNPPFFDDDVSTERTDLRAGDARERTPMTCDEGSYPGGEVGFVSDMIRDSLHYPDRLGWCTCMCGKKSSFQKLKGMLLHLLGPGHVMTTEFGPGHMTRWFLAWTLRRPNLRSPLAQLGEQRRIHVTIADATTVENALLEVTNRIRVYITSIKDYTLLFDVDPGETVDPNLVRAHVRDEKVDCVSLMVDQDGLSLPERISKGLSKKWSAMDCLPKEGHICIYLTIRPKEPKASDVAITVLEVALDCYRHSSTGEKIVQRILSQLEGEVCRNNRRWRRLLKNPQKETHLNDA